MAAAQNLLPFFIRSRSPNGLRRSMLQNNAKYGMTFQYFDIQFAQGSWYAWYYRSLENINADDIRELEQDGTTTQQTR
jgi:hypothetical protein